MIGRMPSLKKACSFKACSFAKGIYISEQIQMDNDSPTPLPRPHLPVPRKKMFLPFGLSKTLAERGSYNYIRVKVRDFFLSCPYD